MKRAILLFVLVNVFLAGVTYAEVTVDGDPIVEGHKGNTNGPKGVLQSVTFQAFGNDLTVDINRYLGNVQVTVTALDGSSTTYNTYFINRHSSFTMGFNGYSTGSCSIPIGLQNGTVYSGTFRLE